MKVFLVVKSLLPSYGGPAFSISRLALALAEERVKVGLWASDMSAMETSLVTPHPCIRRMNGSVAEALDQFGQVDILHDNGIWLPYNHYLAKMAAKHRLLRVVSTRGMLERWARNHKAWKKRLAWWLYQRRDLRRASYLHATATTEAQTLQDLGLGVPIGVIPNGVSIPDTHNGQRSRKGLRTALFLGRLHPIKGLPLILEAWSKLRPPGWQLQIAGPDEVGFRAELERMVCTSSLSGVVHFVGSLDGEAKENALANADLFLLPSFSESFGMVVGEALAHGVAVLTTTAVPWSVIAKEGCGWSVAPTLAGIAEGLRTATSLDPIALSAMGKRGRELVTRDFSWKNIALQFITTYDLLLSAKIR